MFGEFCITERAIASHGAITDAATSASANFTKTHNAILSADGWLALEAVSSIERVGSGILIGESTQIGNFTVTSALERRATGISSQVISATQSAALTRFATGIVEKSANFTQISDGLAVLGSGAELSTPFIQTSSANAEYSGFSSQTFNFVKSPNGGILQSSSAELSAEYIYATLGGTIEFAEADVIALLQTSIAGQRLWEQLRPTTTPSWSFPTRTGTWVEIDADSTNVEQWIEKVV